MSDDKRLIEDYLPIEKISQEASRERSLRKGHISTLHLWWARRPLVACRAAVYGALVPASRFVPNTTSDEKKKSLGRANAAKFVERLCKYPGNPAVIAEAQRHILEAHAERLTQETGKTVTVEDIEEGRAPRPKVLDMFAGGGAIPLEALRLGCEAYALDLNPVAYIIELCTLVYPQRYGKPDPTVRGMTGQKNAGCETSWGGLAEEVRYWGTWVLERARAEIGDLYPLIQQPKSLGPPKVRGMVQLEISGTDFDHRGKHNSITAISDNQLHPVAYIWTRTIECKNPACRARVPLVRQTWLCRKKGRFVALEIVPDKKEKRVRFEVVEATDRTGLKFDPEVGSKRGNTACPVCESIVDIKYVKDQGWRGRMGRQLMVVVAVRRGDKKKIYISPDEHNMFIPSEESISLRIQECCTKNNLDLPRENIANLPIESRDNSLGITVRPYGFRTWADLFTLRQALCILTFASAVSSAQLKMKGEGIDEQRAVAIVTVLAAMVDRLASFSSSFSVWLSVDGERTANMFGRQVLTMVGDFSEVAPFNEENAGWPMALQRVVPAVESARVDRPAVVLRGSAIALPWDLSTFDAVITDPPYYDNVPYADISDFFYVWLKRIIGPLYPEHFASELTPKKGEAIADAGRHGGSRDLARRSYEEMMGQAFREAHRVLKAGGELAVVYAHKTTLGWATLVDALRNAGFTVQEAWPLDTEKPGRLRAQESSALASSIFLIAKKREGQGAGNFENEVRPNLETIVRERVATLWEMGISGADLVIACVGAGLRAFTRFARVEYANGEEVPAERFLMEVETVVLESILARLSKEVGGNGSKYGLASLEPATRFYLLWRYTYKAADLDSGEAIIFANGTHVELDGQRALSSGTRPLVEKKKAKYHLLDYSERGADAKLGLPSEEGIPAPLIDALHRLLWLMERHPSGIPEFLREARPNTEQMRLVAQALAGPALKGGELGEVATGSELAALTKLTANWRSVVEDVDLTSVEREARRAGQSRIQFEKGGR